MESTFQSTLQSTFGTQIFMQNSEDEIMGIPSPSRKSKQTKKLKLNTPDKFFNKSSPETVSTGKNLIEKISTEKNLIEKNPIEKISSDFIMEKPITYFSSDPDFIEIDRLQDLGVNVADLKKLKEAGLNTALSVIYTMKKDLCNIKGLSELKVEKIQEAARKISHAGFMTGSEFIKHKISSRFKISTGASKIDALLGGGIESCTITEIFGEFRCGKTQICHSLAVISQMGIGGVGGGRVAFIDTENTFRPDRISSIASYYNLDENKVLDNILYARCFNSEHLIQLLICITQKMSEEKFVLLIIDSIMGPFRVDFSGRGELSERQQLLGKCLTRLQKLSEEFNIAVIITNQVMSDPSTGMTFVAQAPKPVGGHIIAHFSTTRLALRKGRAEQRIMKIFDSPCLPEGEAIYEICSRGIQDAKD